MVPDKFNMVDMEGIDLIESQEVEIPGLYQKLVESIAQCRYQCLYNWKFDGILSPPTYVEMVVTDEEVSINGGVSVDSEDIVHIESLVIPTVIEAMSVTENGVYEAPVGVDGFAPVTVNVPIPQPVVEPITITENGVYTPSSGVDGFSQVSVNVQQAESRYEYVESDYAGLGYSYVAINGGYYGAGDSGQMLTIYEVPPGDYVVFCGNPVGTRFRCVLFYGKTTEDFMSARDVSMQQTLIFSGDLVVTGATDRSGDLLLQRLYFTMAQAGCVAVGTSNSGQSVESILLRINS